jgi:protocatechuate 3,4-dioxygenase beta subunit
LAGAALIVACGPVRPTGTGGAGGSGSGGSGGGLCTLYPRQTEGPYYLDLDLLRSDITESRPGALLSLALQVVRSGSCVPISDAAVDIWQCDAQGVYGGYAGQLGGVDTRGQTFLRGTQVTDAEGRVRFRTIYPGWYPGRTTHIHFKVHLSPTSIVTSQIYFPEELTRGVYATPPYAAHGQKDTTNAADFIARSGGGMPALPSIVEAGSGYEGTLTIAVAG